MISFRYKRRKPSRFFTPVRYTSKESSSVERAVEEGLMIAKTALAMELKNHIIVGAIRYDKNFVESELREFLSGEIDKLALEQSGYADRTDSWAAASTSAQGPQANVHDYRSGDYGSLTKRGQTYTAMASALTVLAGDDEFLAGVLASAQSQAWSEIERAIMARLEGEVRSSTEKGYTRTRKERMRQVREIDLLALNEANLPEY
jgi:hypothetical protein